MALPRLRGGLWSLRGRGFPLVLALGLAPLLVVVLPPADAYALSGGGLLTTTRSLALADAPVELSAAQRAAQLATSTGGAVRVGGAVASMATASGGLAAVATPAAVAIVGLGIGWEVGSSAAQIFGLDSDGALQDLLGLKPVPDPVTGAQFVPNRNGDTGGYSYTGLSLYSASGQGAGELGVLRAPPYVINGSFAERDVTYGESVYAIGGGGPYRLVMPVVTYPRDGDDARAFPVTMVYRDGSRFTSTAGLAGGFLSGPGMSYGGALSNDSGFDHLEWTDASGTHSYYPAGHPAAPRANPEQRFETTVRCSDGTTLTSLSVGFRETDAEFPPPPDPSQCPSGSRVTGVEVAQTTSGGPRQTIALQSEPPAVAQWASENPNCLAGGCVMELQRIDSTTGTWNSCEGAGLLCRDWAETSNRDQVYRCRYNGATIGLDECAPYQKRYNPTETARPIVGDPLPTPGTGTTPGTGGDPAPTPGGSGSPDPSEDGAECWPTGWGVLNPLEWVYRPVSCALSAAFVPSPQSVASLRSSAGTFATRAPVPEVTSVVRAVGGLAPTGSGCLRVPVTLPDVLGGSTLTAFDSCGDDPATVWLREHRTLMTALVWLGFLSPLAWWAWRTYAPGATGVA